MKYGWLTCLMIAGAAIFIGGCDMAPMDFDLSKVDNPDYAAWKGFPVGSGFEFAGMKQDAVETPRQIHISSELMVFDRTQAVVKRKTQIFERGDEGSLEIEDVIIPARIKNTAHPQTQPDVQNCFRGWDSLLIGETRYDCEVHYYIVKYDAEMMGIDTKGETGMKIWHCKKIPGGIAKIEIASLTPSRLFLMSGQVIKVNVGPVAGRPVSTYTPAPAAPVKTQTPAPAPAPAVEEQAPVAAPAPTNAADSKNAELENAVTAPDHLPIMPEPDKKVHTAGFNTSTSQPSDEEEAAPKVVLPATRKPDPQLLSEMNEAVEGVQPKSLDENSATSDGATPAGENETD